MMSAALRVMLLASALTGCGQSGADATATASSPTAGDFAGDLNALGTEPFWAIKIRADGLTFSRPGVEDVKSANPGPVIENDRATWTVADGPTPFKLTLTKGDCSDGMSDRHYAMNAVLVFADKTMYGCAATPASIAAQPAP
ncbi:MULTISPECIES: membrane protein [unclassified Rhizobium]|uniref:COG3650 family protein n=1 Tax=unclassified Rhizobium TaxID=2613769 RepID=UPI0002E0B286|nr:MULTISPECIES: membrane protein [unclassified Rhizobium]MBB3394536.1 putative membrane protein [Rhizobium sp. BK060]MBB4167773.1 putative membrane protein [Rhizobium sp. BK538]